MKTTIQFLSVALLMLLAATGRAAETDVMRLLEGVNTITAPGIPGGLAVYGPKSFAVVAGKNGDAQLPVVAAVAGDAVTGAGHIAVFGHDGYLAPDALDTVETGVLLANLVRWAQPTNTAKITVAGEPKLAAWLRQRGFTVEASDAIPDSGVLIVSGHSIGADQIAPLADFVARGNGLITAATGWGWAQIHSGRDLARDFPANQLLSRYGIVFSPAMLERTAEQGFNATPPAPQLHAGRALETVLRFFGEAAPVTPEITQAAATVGDAAIALPPDDSLLLPKLRALASDHTGDVVPFPRRPINKSDVAARLLLSLQTSIAKSLPASQVRAHPAGAIFPGDVPPNAKPVTRTVKIDTSVPDWHSLGLYAAPGSTVTVTLPPAAVGKGLGARIGCHTDTLWQLDEWKRAPDISRAFPLRDTTTTIANPFGGLVYIIVPGNAELGTIDVTLGGAYEAPRFVLGETNLDTWRASLRWMPGPWAELESRKIILTVPSRAVRALDDPEAVLKFYDAGMDAVAELATIPQQRRRPERIVADEQISAGYMHSGYPIMTWLDVEQATIDLPTLQKGAWGHWHEIGHNHQVGDWTFDGTGEVTNNLFVLYVFEKLSGIQPIAARHDVTPAGFAEAWRQYDAGGRKFEDWKSNPFLALNMYIQLQQAFGWDTFQKVFAEYRALPSNERPQNDDEKRDQWLIRFSRAAGRNLGPFFEAWGVPTSPAARAALADLPPWMPEDMGNE